MRKRGWSTRTLALGGILGISAGAFAAPPSNADQVLTLNNITLRPHPDPKQREVLQLIFTTRSKPPGPVRGRLTVTWSEQGQPDRTKNFELNF